MGNLLCKASPNTKISELVRSANENINLAQRNLRTQFLDAALTSIGTAQMDISEAQSRLTNSSSEDMRAIVRDTKERVNNFEAIILDRVDLVKKAG